MQSNFPANTVPTKKSNGYMPGKFYRCIGPITTNDFENPKIFNLAVPVKVIWFLPDTGHENKHFYFCNLSGKDTAVSYNMTPCINTQPNEREYVQELGSRDVKHGTTVCFAIIPYCFHLSFAEPQLDLRLRYYYSTFSGSDIEKLRGKHLEIYENADSQTLDIREGNPVAVGPNYAVITNATTNVVTVNLHKYPVELDDVQEVVTVSNARVIDLGPEVIEQIRVEPKRSWHIRPQGTYYTVRIEDAKNANPQPSHTSTITQVPDKEDYVEGPMLTNVRASDFVVFTTDSDQCISNLKCYTFDKIKPVASTMVTNKTVGEND